jgi:hypothetical protein
VNSDSRPTLANSEKAPAQVKNYVQFGHKLDVFVAIGPYIYHDPVLMYKLLRIAGHYLEHVSFSVINRNILRVQTQILE